MDLQGIRAPTTPSNGVAPASFVEIRAGKWRMMRELVGRGLSLKRESHGLYDNVVDEPFLFWMFFLWLVPNAVGLV